MSSLHSEQSIEPRGPATPRVPLGVLSKVAETFAVGLAMLHRSLSTLEPVAAAQQGHLDAIRSEVGRLEFLGIRLQEFSRILSGDAPLPTERLDLARALRETLAAWSPAGGVAGVTIVDGDAPRPVQANAAVLEQLLCLAIECALHTGPAVEVSTGDHDGPARPTLTIRAMRPAGARTSEQVEDFGDLHWTLFALLARAVGLAPQRLVAGHVVTMLLGFPDPAAGGQAHDDGLPRTAAATGRHVLLIEPGEFARVTAHDLLRQAGMHVDAVANLDQARDGLRDGAPDIVVTGLPLDDARVAALLDEARAARPGLRVIQLVDDDNAFAFSVPGSGCPGQVGRGNLAQTLVAAVAQELDAAGA